MVYAYDQWAQMPVKDLYDTQVMAMAINAAKYMYDKGEQRMKDFYKEYGDFMSPIQKDMDWYNQNVTGRVRDVINSMYANGIDPLRSAEGRAAVAQLIYSMPTGDIARVRQSAEAAKEYIKNRGILEAAGKWDPNFERFANNGQMLEDWDTINGGNGIWNRTSPAEVKSLKELTESWYNNRQPHTLDKTGVESFGVAYDPRYEYSGFTNKDLLDIAAGQTPGWNGTVYADYYRQIAKDKLRRMGIDNPDSKLVEAQLQKDIATANKEYLINPSRSISALYLQQLKNSQARAIAGLRRKIEQQQEAPTTFMDRLQRNMDLNFEKKIAGQNNYEKTFGSIVDYWDKMAKSVENKGKVIGTKQVEETSTKPITQAYPSPFGGGLHFSTTKNTRTENTYDQSKNKLYKKYIYERDRWAKFYNDRKYEPSKYDTRKTADGKYIVNIIRGIIEKGDKATPQERQILQNYQKDDFIGMAQKAMSNSPEWSGKGSQSKGTMSVTDAKKRASAYWDTFSAEGLGPIQSKVLHQVFMNTDDTVKDPDLPENQGRVRFESGYHYAPTRQMNISGSGRFKHNDIHSRFDRFLQGEYGISTDPTDVRVSGIPHAGYAGRQLDILKHPAITKEQLMQFVNSLQKSKYKNMSIDDVAKHLGLKAVNKKLTYRGKDEQLHSTDTYYEVPVIRTIENLGGYNYRDINALSDIIEFNAGTADKNIINSENQSAISDLPIELAIQLLQE